MPESKSYRYPGLKPFSAEESKLFFGRKKDIAELEKIIQIEKQLVLHSKSGLGKSSLLNAGLAPRLEKQEHFKIIRIRFSAYQEGGSSLRETVRQLMGEVCSLNQAPGGLTAAEDTLWYVFKQAQIALGEDTVFVLVFDQFEETFTYPEAELMAFKTQLANVLNNSKPRAFQEAMEKAISTDKMSDEDLRIISNPLKVKALFAIRSDKISLMDELKDVLPDILSRTYRLMPLSRDQAEDAILNPAYQKGKQFHSQQFDFTDEALDAILDFLTKGGEQQVESFQLQIICQFVEHIVIQEGKKLIERRDLGEINDIFENYYESLINRLPSEVDKAKARVFIEEGLILEADEIRLSLHEGQVDRDFEISKNLLAQLVETRLIRGIRSPRGGYVYELSHDTLIKPILKAKDRRLLSKRLAQEQALKEAEEIAKKAKESKDQKRLLRFAAAAAFLIIAAVYGQGKYSEYRQSLQNTKDKDRIIDSLLAIQSGVLTEIEVFAEQSGNTGLADKIAEEKAKVESSMHEEVTPRPVPTTGAGKDRVAFEQLFSDDESVRKTGQNWLVTRLTNAPKQRKEITGEALAYANSHLASAKEGHWIVLYLLDERTEDAALLAHGKVLRQYLNGLETDQQGRFAGKRTTKRIQDLKARIEKLEGPDEAKQVLPVPDSIQVKAATEQG